MIRCASLFSGIAGLDRGVEQGLAMLGHRSRVIWQAEKDPYARAVLRKNYPNVPCYEDVHDIDESAETPDVLDGGFPCQDLSIAGKRAGIDGARSGLWSENVRIIRVLRPGVVFVENVPELLRFLGRVLGPLAELGYDAEWDLFDAASVGAPHRRERLFVLAFRPGALAHADGHGQQQQAIRGDGQRLRPGDDGEDVPDTGSNGLADAEQQVTVGGAADDGRKKLVAYTHGERREGGLSGGLSAALAAAPRLVADPMLPRRPRAEDGPHEGRNGPAIGGRWPPEPGVGRVVDGPSSRLDARRRRARLRCLGNGAVEQQAALAFVTLARRAGLGRRHD